MSDKQYDLSSEEKRLFALKQQQRLAAKQYFQNFVQNPHRPLTESPFDIKLHRFGAMSAYHVDSLKPTGRIIGGTLLLMGTMLLLTAYTINFKAKEEELLRSGAVKYSDRKYKLIF